MTWRLLPDGRMAQIRTMRYRLRTLMIVLTAVCMLCGWYAYLGRMAAYHRRKASDPFGPMISLSPVPPPVFLSRTDEYNLWSYHAKRANDFDYALLRPWLAFFDCKPDSMFGAPLPQEKRHILERLNLYRKSN